MIFKKNNPGCPCCCPCACYKFEDNLVNSAGAGTLEKHDAAGSQTYVTGKIGKGLKIEHNSTHNRNAVKVGHRNCLSTTNGFSVWLWVYHDADTSDCTASGVSQILRKGSGSSFTGSGVPEWVLSTAATPQCHTSSLTSVLFGVGNTSGGTETISTNPYGHTRAETQPATWSFYFMYYDPTVGSHGATYLSSQGADFQKTTLTVSTPVTNTDDLFIGGQIAEADSYVIIDELGFCEEIGTEAEMVSRKNNLYNSGNGKSCMEWR